MRNTDLRVAVLVYFIVLSVFICLSASLSIFSLLCVFNSVYYAQNVSLELSCFLSVMPLIQLIV